MIASPSKGNDPQKRGQINSKERTAIFVIIVLFVLLLLALFFTFKRPEGPGHSPAESPFVKQRIINLQKSQ